MNITFSPCQPEDSHALWPGHRAAFMPVIQAQFGGWNEHEQFAAFQRRMAKGGFVHVLVNAQRAGAMRVVWAANPVELADIWLEPAWQNRRIGRHVVQWVVNEALQRGRQVRLAVLFANPALRLYTRLGFLVVGKTAHQYLMQTPLPTQPAH